MDDYAHTFEELLEIGQRNLECEKLKNVLRIESQLTGKYLDYMIELNKYVYTTYLTNFY